MPKKTLVFGASINPDRYSYLAIVRLFDKGHPVVAFGLNEGVVHGVKIDNKL
ncbi:MAG TPA: CoA-binding protein, partial [Aquaticitalea sp.]|nr:CoA-binding protein [Aquaticitalea sp.]